MTHVEATQGRRSDWTSGATVAGHVLFVYAAPIAAAAAGPWWGLPLAWLAFGLFANGLLNLLHECAHGLVFRTKKRSVALGRYVIAPLLGADFDSYRSRHWAHHRELGTERDTKLTYREGIQGWRLFALILRAVTLTEGLRKFGLQTNPHLGRIEFRPQGTAWIVRAAIAQAVVLSVLFAVALPASDGFVSAALWALLVYAVTVLYGLISLTSLMASLRAIAEHQRTGTDEAHEGAAALRNFSCGPLENLLFGCYGFAEHHTHHERAALPYYQLGEVTDQLEEEGLLPARNFGYVSFLARLQRSNADASPGREASG